MSERISGPILNGDFGFILRRWFHALAISQCLHLLDHLFKDVNVPQSVYDEVVVPNKSEAESYVFKKAENIPPFLFQNSGQKVSIQLRDYQEFSPDPDTSFSF